MDALSWRPWPLQLAEDVLTMAADAGMPDTFWATDTRIQRACDALGWTPQQAMTFARRDRRQYLTGVLLP